MKKINFSNNDNKNKSSQPRLVDAFTYNGEDDLLRIRLEYLYKDVDRFVIVEADKTFTGIKKEQKFDLNRFKRWSEKIAYFFIEDLYASPSTPWVNEITQRNALVMGLYELSDDDLILLSDIDEIPRLEAIKEYNSKKYVYACLLQSLHFYKLNLQVHDEKGNPVVWNKSKIITYRNFKKYFKNLTELRWEKYSGPFRSFRRFYLDNRRQFIPNAGWHFTYMMTADKIVEKLKSYSHSDLNTPEHNNIANISSLIKSGKLVTGGDCTLTPCKIDTQFPKNVAEMQEFIKLSSK